MHARSSEGTAGRCSGRRGGGGAGLGADGLVRIVAVRGAVGDALGTDAVFGDETLANQRRGDLGCDRANDHGHDLADEEWRFRGHHHRVRAGFRCKLPEELRDFRGRADEQDVTVITADVADVLARRRHHLPGIETQVDPELHCTLVATVAVDDPGRRAGEVPIHRAGDIGEVALDQALSDDTHDGRLPLGIETGDLVLFHDLSWCGHPPSRRDGWVGDGKGAS